MMAKIELLFSLPVLYLRSFSDVRTSIAVFVFSSSPMTSSEIRLQHHLNELKSDIKICSFKNEHRPHESIRFSDSVMRSPSPIEFPGVYILRPISAAA